MNKYNILVSVTNGKTPPRCKWPKETPRSGLIRGYRRIYTDDFNNIKEIVYPTRFWLTTITPNDPLEMNIINIINMWPDWYRIEVM